MHMDQHAGNGNGGGNGVKREDIALDPDGDVTLVLYKNTNVFDRGSAAVDGSGGTPRTPRSAGSAGSPVPAPDTSTSAAPINNMSPRNSLLSQSTKSQNPPVGLLGSPPRKPQPEQRLHLYALVSSKHLMLASTVFRAMLRPRASSSSARPANSDSSVASGPQLSEASTLQATGRVEIPLPEDDLDAMLVIMRIIHHRYDEVSRHIPRSLLAQVAVLVDKYDLRRSVEFVSTTWFDNFALGGAKKKGATMLPTRFCGELLEWLFVSWVFGYADIFFSMTRIAMAQSWCRLDNESLLQFPFPEVLIETIDTRRQHSISKILSVYESHISASWGDGSGRVSCPADIAECDAKVLGTLLRAGRQLSIYPIPTAPYPGISFTDLHRDLDGVDVPTCGEHYYYNRTDFNDALNLKVKGEFAEGLLLKSFLPAGGG